MQTFFIPALDLLYQRLQKGFSRRQKIWAALLGLVILGNFIFRAACPPERRFFKSPTSQTIALCASPDMVKNTVPLGTARNAKTADPERGSSLL
jgi:hypothetical protein